VWAVGAQAFTLRTNNYDPGEREANNVHEREGKKGVYRGYLSWKGGVFLFSREKKPDLVGRGGGQIHSKKVFLLIIEKWGT